MRAIVLSLLLAGCGASKEADPPPDCDVVLAANPCLDALLARVDAFIESVDEAAGAFEATAAAAAAGCDAVRALGADSIDVRTLSPACGESAAARLDCAAERDPSFDPASVSLSCSQGSDALAGECAGDCSGDCVREAPADCEGTCFDVCGGTCAGASSRGVCLGICTGPCSGTCVSTASGACAGQCVGACTEEMGGAICVGGVWNVADECLGACDRVEVACSGRAASFADAPGSDTDAELAAALDGLEPTLSAYAFTSALSGAWLVILTDETTELTAKIEVTDLGDLTDDEIRCFPDRLRSSATALDAASADLTARVEDATATWAASCQ